MGQNLYQGAVLRDSHSPVTSLYQGAVLRDSHSPVTSQDWPAALASWYSEVELFKQDPTKGRVHLILLRNLMD